MSKNKRDWSVFRKEQKRFERVISRSKEIVKLREEIRKKEALMSVWVRSFSALKVVDNFFCRECGKMSSERA